MKPFVYAAAFDSGICTPKAILFDTPTAWPGYVPNNFDHVFRGPMPAAEALAESRNIPALVLLGHVGVEHAIGVLESFGFSTIAHAKRPYGLTLAIGGAEATPLEIAEAYATLARGGIWRKTSLVRDQAMPEHRVMRAVPCWQTLHAICGAERTAALCAEAAAMHVAWKTGTSSGHRDAWCAAVTPRRTVIVWLGNPRGEASSALVGQEAAAPLALRLISTLDSGGETWPETSDIKSSSVQIAIASRSHSTLSISSPSRDQHILLNADSAASGQQVLLEAPASSGEIWWFVDGEPVGRSTRTWWTPTIGAHQIRLVDDEGHSAAVAVQVQSAEMAAD